MSDKRLDTAAQALVAAADKHGIALEPVKDGYVLIVTRARMQEVLQKMDEEKSDKAILYIKDINSIN
jgi:hypothetical protein